MADAACSRPPTAPLYRIIRGPVSSRLPYTVPIIWFCYNVIKTSVFTRSSRFPRRFRKPRLQESFLMRMQFSFHTARRPPHRNWLALEFVSLPILQVSIVIRKRRSRRSPGTASQIRGRTRGRSCTPASPEKRKQVVFVKKKEERPISGYLPHGGSESSLHDWP